MTIGRMHIADGFIVERTHDVKTPIVLGLTHGGDPFNLNTPIIRIWLSESQCASIMAHIARRGETGDTYREALKFLQDTGIKDDDPVCIHCGAVREEHGEQGQCEQEGDSLTSFTSELSIVIVPHCINCDIPLESTAYGFGPSTPPGAPRKEVGPFCERCYKLILAHCGVKEKS